MKHWVRTVLEGAFPSPPNLTDRQRLNFGRIISLIEGNDVYSFRTTELEQIANDLSVCEDFTDLSELMWRAATSTGFQNFAVFVLSQGRVGNFHTRICTSYSNAWIERYQNKKYQYVDPVMARANLAEGSFFFSELCDSAPLVQEFWADAEQHKIGRNGLCFSMNRSDGAKIGVSFSTGEAGSRFDDLIRMNGSDLMFISQLAADCFCDLSLGSPLPNCVLDENELRFLYMLASGQDPKQACEVMAKYGSNDALQASIRSKLGVSSVFQAVAIASLRCWFDELPYEPLEVARPFPTLDGLDAEKSVLDANHTQKASSSEFQPVSD